MWTSKGQQGPLPQSSRALVAGPGPAVEDASLGLRPQKKVTGRELRGWPTPPSTQSSLAL